MSDYVSQLTGQQIENVLEGVRSVTGVVKRTSDTGYAAAGAGDVGAVSYQTTQLLTSTEKTRARTNIGAGTYSKQSSGIPKSDLASAVQTSIDKADSAISFNEQSLTEAQKAQARANIGAARQGGSVDAGNVGYSSSVEYDFGTVGYALMEKASNSDLDDAFFFLLDLIAIQHRRIGVLKNLLEGVAYSIEEETTEAFEKTVPSGAQAVSINRIYGKSVIDETTGEVLSVPVDAVYSIEPGEGYSFDEFYLPNYLLGYLADKGYGEAPVDGDGNFIDFENRTYTQKGSYVDNVWVELEEPIVYGIADLLPFADDYNLLSTKPGGMIAFGRLTETDTPVPVNITWAIKNSEVTV